MSSITINSNIAALTAQRRLGQSTRSLQDSFTRLSSGLRINRARDDASGLAISEDLKVDSRVFNQGVRNINEAIGLLNIAEGAGKELGSILIRTRELSTQAANGTLAHQQRKALDEEADALVEEYNRIVASVDFNGTKLLDGSVESLRVQAGYGEAGSISFGLSDGIARTVGDGSFQAFTSFGIGGGSARGVEAGDFNEDGVLDVVTAVSNQLSVSLGVGDGSFKASVEYSPSSLAREVELADLNDDGHIDLVSSVWGATSSIVTSFGNGDGTFKAGVSYSTTAHTFDLRLADFNGDGIKDVATATESSKAVNILLGNSDGSFRARTLTPLQQQAGHLDIGDFNDDGYTDIVTGSFGGAVELLIGRGDGSFQDSVQYIGSGGSDVDEVDVGDFNNDGALDVVVSNQSDSSINLILGNGDGTLKAYNEIGAAGEASFYAEVADLDGDGNLDIVSASTTVDPRLYFGNGDGTFRASVSVEIGLAGDTGGMIIEDVNGDGALDFVRSDFGGNSFSVHLANTQETTFLAKLDLKTRDGALEAMGEIDQALIRVNQELGGIGATQSRLSTAVGNLQVARENYNAAASQIVDVDVASESARLVRSQILQQAGAAILAQANQSPALALALLS